MKCNNTRIVVIGAGFAGLSAALKLKKEGIEAIILEARERVGGRVKTHYTANGTQIPLGGQWIGPTQDKMYELVKKYGIEIFPTKDQGNSIVKFQGKIQSEMPQEVLGLCEKLDKLAQTVNLEKPWETPNAKELDGETFRSWLNREAVSSEIAEFTSRYLAGNFMAADASDVSLLQLLFYVKSGNGIDSLAGVEGGAQQDRAIGGLEYIVEKLADDFGQQNIYYNHPVTQIKYSGDCVQVVTENETFHASRAIITIPSAVMPEVKFTPELPVLKHKCLEHVLAPLAYKMHFIYDKPFWYEQGLSGNTTKSEGYVYETYNNTVDDSRDGIISLFSYGNEANELRGKTKQERQQIITDELVELFGEKAAQFKEYIEYDWSTQVYTRGCFSGHFSTNGWYTLGKELNKNVGPLYWAGTELAAQWNGYCDGAVRSGEETADRVIKSLKPGEQNQQPHYK